MKVYKENKTGADDVFAGWLVYQSMEKFQPVSVFTIGQLVQKQVWSWEQTLTTPQLPLWHLIWSGHQ